MQHACGRYANDHLDPPTAEESWHNVYLSKIQPLMHRASVVMKAIGLCEWRSLFQSFILQPGVEYTPLATLRECFITDQIPGVGTAPSSHIHIHYTHAMWSLGIMHVEDMRVNWMPFHLLGERFDCIFNVGGYKHDRMSSQAAIVATVTLVCRNSFWRCQIIPSYLWRNA